MSAEASPGFLDTNILLYAISGSPDEADKKERARALLAQPGQVLSCQVLQEFYVQATSARKGALPHRDALAIVQHLADTLDVIPLTLATVMLALQLRERYQMHYWDAAIIAAAKQSGAATVFSEDLAHGQEYAGVTVINPFV
jgi:predicted nucleic acid-binding protein